VWRFSSSTSSSVAHATLNASSSFSVITPSRTLSAASKSTFGSVGVPSVRS
jgi:hypothetical protein